jgi:predicted ATPase
MLGASQLRLGDLTQAHAQLQQGAALYLDPVRLMPMLAQEFYPGDPGIYCLADNALALWLLGYPDQALAANPPVPASPEQASNSYNLMLAHYYSARLHKFRRDAAATGKSAGAALAICQQQGLALFAAAATILQGWALAMQQRSQEGMERLDAGWADYQAVHGKVSSAYFLGCKIEMDLIGGHIERGLSTVTEAFDYARDTEECWYDAELYRLRGELLLAGGPAQQSEALADLQQALYIARQQQARSLELRAALSLARLWQSRGSHERALELLEPVYAGFNEGFDTADLREAQTLLGS